MTLVEPFPSGHPQTRRRFLGALAALALAGCADSGGNALLGHPLPPLRLPDRNGHLHEFAAFVGHPLVINFWATWCPPCRDEMPSLDRLAQRERARGLIVVGVNVDPEKPAVEEFLYRIPVDFLILLDPGGKQTSRLGIRGYPTTLLADRAHVVRGVVVGAADWERHPAIADLLA